MGHYGTTGSRTLRALCQCPQVSNSLKPYIYVRLSISHSSYSVGEVALFLQELVEVVDGEERIRMLIAEGFALPLQRLA